MKMIRDLKINVTVRENASIRWGIWNFGNEFIHGIRANAALHNDSTLENYVEFGIVIKTYGHEMSAKIQWSALNNRWFLINLTRLNQRIDLKLIMYYLVNFLA